MNESTCTTRPSVEGRFWQRVRKLNEPCAERADLGPCWMWVGHIMVTGYGQFSYGGRKDNRKDCAHRFSYELANGKIPDGLHIDHLCRVRACVNPAHLEAVTQAENNRRIGGRATNDIGDVGRALIKNMRRIRTEQGLTFRELAERLDHINRPIQPVPLARIESGKRRVDADDLVAIADVLGVGPLDLLLPYAEPNAS